MQHKLFMLVLCGLAWLGIAQTETHAETPKTGEKILETAQKLEADGKYVDAITLIDRVLFGENADAPTMNAEWLRKENATHLATILKMRVNALNFLNRSTEIDAFLEKFIETYKTDWRAMQCVAVTYQEIPHHGRIVAGEFYRGNQQRNGEYASVMERDRVRSLQLMTQALELAQKDEDTLSAGWFFFDFAEFLLQGRNHATNSWELQDLTDISTLPEPDARNPYGSRPRPLNSQLAQGTPITEDGKPMTFALPESFATAKNDGERWRWALEQAEKLNAGKTIPLTDAQTQNGSVAEVKPGRTFALDSAFRAEKMYRIAQFYQRQLGEQTLEHVWSRLNAEREDTQTGKQEITRTGSLLALETLTDAETIAQTATGIQRFQMPEGANYIAIYQELAKTPGRLQKYAVYHLAKIMENRRQYALAIEFYAQVKEVTPFPIPKKFMENPYPHVNGDSSHITGNYGRLMTQKQQSSENPTLSIRFRNAKKATFTATRIDIDKLFNEINSRIAREAARGKIPQNEVKLDFLELNPQQIGWELMQEQRQEYLTAEKTTWETALEPAENYHDSTVSVPLKVATPGAYLVEMQMENGNRAYTVAWVFDMMIVLKRLDGKLWYYVADTRTGKAIPGAVLHFNGWRQEWSNNDRRRGAKVQIFQKKFDATCDENGAWTATSEELPDKYQYIVTASLPDSDRVSAFMDPYRGRINISTYNSIDYEHLSAYGITDRPIYRPEQKVFYKFWTARAEYDGEDYLQNKASDENRDFSDVGAYANREVTLKIYDPNHEMIEERRTKTDANGSVSGEFLLPKDAKLGQYNVVVEVPRNGNNHGYELGNITFRMEEYRKPEFEVTVETPKEPVALGDTLKVNILSRYYFGAPVANGTVKYRIFRTSYTHRWYAPAPWDWLYGPGYWWHANDYAWYPGWARWGCLAPTPIWEGRGGNDEELVMEGEIQLTSEMEGKAEITIDTTLAAALYGDRDHQYRITAEVEDASRRVITGEGTILATRQPFRVNVWTQRGYLTVGDQIPVHIATKTIDGKPITGAGKLRVLEVTYDENGTPTEKEIQTADIQTDADGNAKYDLKATHAGQFRISCTATGGGDILISQTRDGDIPVRETNENQNAKTVEGGMVLTVHGEGFSGSDLRFNELELIPDKADYQPGETVKLMVNTNLNSATVVLFERCVDGVCSKPRYIHMTGKSQIIELPVRKCDHPNFFIEGLVTTGSQVYTVTKEICVPPEKRLLNLEVLPSKTRYLPGEKAEVTLKLTDLQGKPFTGETVLSVYDKSLEALAGGTNIRDIYRHFWSWKRWHRPHTVSTNYLTSTNMYRRGDSGMTDLGGFSGVFFFGETYSPYFLKIQNGLQYQYALRKSKKTMAFGRATAESSRMLESNMMVDAAAVPMAAAAPAMLAEEKSMEFVEEDLMDEEEEILGVERGAGLRKNAKKDAKRNADGAGGTEEEPKLVEATIRKNFADTAYWTASLKTDENGLATVTFPMPENLTTWKLRTWAMGDGTRVGKAETEVITAKNLLIRMQTPRFLTTSDEVYFTANVHNYLAIEKKVVVTLTLPENAPCRLLEEKTPKTVTVTVPANGETRVDWTVRAENEGECLVTMSAQTDEESDAMQLTLPIQIHGMAKQDARSGMISGGGDIPVSQTKTGTMEFTIPDARRPQDSALEIRFSPTLAGAMLDAIPYLVEYPYGCTEQTVSRFLPAALVRKALTNAGVNLSEIAIQTNNLNAQEIGSARERNAQWEKQIRNRKNDLVFNDAILNDMVSVGVDRLVNMQCSDGGWGWFSGAGEMSSPHLTSHVTRGLLLAQQAEIFGELENPQTVSRAIQNALTWLTRYLKREIEALRLGDELQKLIDSGDMPEDGSIPERFKKRYYKLRVGEMDALVFATLAQARTDGGFMSVMEDYIYRDRVQLSPQSNALAGIAFFQRGDVERYRTILEYLTQFLVVDEENQTAHLSLPSFCYWWRWYGNDVETQATYLRLLTLDTGTETEKNSLKTASYLVKYLLNNRKNATYWNSTRDTASVLEAFTHYLKRTDELNPNMTVEAFLDGKLVKTVEITPKNLFTCDNTFLLEGDDVAGGTRTVELRRTGTGTLYYNGYARYFTLEDFIPKTGLEVKLNRQYYRLIQEKDATRNATDSRGKLVKQSVLKYRREPINVGDAVTSGDLIEVELTLESKNDYTYILIEDMKPAGFETVDAKSGYNGNALGAYVEFRDNRVAFFVRTLNQGKHSVSYRMRAETPGKVSALPTRMEAMYAPELKANSDEMKIECRDE